MFTNIGADKRTGRKYCIIDALDECDPESQETLLSQLEAWVSSSNIRLLITSRPYPEIERYLKKFPNSDLTSFPESKQDIELFIDEKVSELERKNRYTKRLKTKWCRVLGLKLKEPFLWVGLAYEELRRIPSKDAAGVLRRLPKGVHSIYSELLGAIDPAHWGTVRNILTFVAVSLEPLSLLDISAACQLHQTEAEEERIQFMREEIASCRLILVEQDEKIHLIHQSVKDFIFGAALDWCLIKESEAHAKLAYRCLDYYIMTQ